MYVCICNAVTSSEIHEAAASGVTNLMDLTAKLGVAAGCGTCRATASKMLAEHRKSDKARAEPILYRRASA